MKKKKHTALMYAIEAKQFEFVDRLLKIPNIDVCYSKESGQTCLMWAIEEDLDQTAEKHLNMLHAKWHMFSISLSKNYFFVTFIF